MAIILTYRVVNYGNDTEDEGKITELVNILCSRIKIDQKYINSKTELSASVHNEFPLKKSRLLRKQNI